MNGNGLLLCICICAQLALHKQIITNNVVIFSVLILIEFGREMTDKIDKHLADDIGIKLVDIFYSNTQLNYDVCAHNLVEVLEHLRSQLPDFQSVTGQLVESIQSSVREKHTNPDLMCLEKNLQCMKALSDRLQSGELNFYECNDKIRLYLAQSIKLIVLSSLFFFPYIFCFFLKDTCVNSYFVDESLSKQIQQSFVRFWWKIGKL